MKSYWYAGCDVHYVNEQWEATHRSLPGFIVAAESSMRKLRDQLRQMKLEEVYPYDGTVED